MASACIKITKYFLFLFNLLFFILGAMILGFGVWVLADRSSFISVLQTSSSSLKVGAYVFITVGAVTMLMGFLGCIGAIREVRCLLGLYITFLLLIFIAQVTAGVLFYLNMGKLKQEMGGIVSQLIQNYQDGQEDSLQEAWDYVQAQVKCCGWASFYNWTDNAALMNRTNITFPCSCKRREEDSDTLERRGFCEAPRNATQSGNSPEDWPVYRGSLSRRRGLSNLPLEPPRFPTLRPPRPPSPAAAFRRPFPPRKRNRIVCPLSRTSTLSTPLLMQVRVMICFLLALRIISI